MEQKPIKVYYWKIRGKVIYVNHFLAALNVPFEMIHFTSREDWGKKKMEIFPEYPFVNLPMIRDPNKDNKYRAETSAILQYLARTYSPEAGATTLEEAEDIWRYYAAIDDLDTSIKRKFFQFPDIETLKQKITEDKMRVLSKLLLVKNTLAKNEWMFKNRFTYVDVQVAGFAEFMLAFEKEFNFEFFSEDERKVFVGHMEKVYAKEGIKKWRSSDQFFVKPFVPPQMTPWK